MKDFGSFGLSNYFNIIWGYSIFYFNNFQIYLRACLHQLFPTTFLRKRERMLQIGTSLVPFLLLSGSLIVFISWLPLGEIKLL